MQTPLEKYTRDIKLPEQALPINKGDMFCEKIEIFYSLITKQKCKLWTVVKTAVQRLTCTATHYHYMQNVSRQKFHTNYRVEFEPDLYETYLLTYIKAAGQFAWCLALIESLDNDYKPLKLEMPLRRVLKFSKVLPLPMPILKAD